MIETGRIDLFNLVYLRNKHCASVRTLSSRRDELMSIQPFLPHPPTFASCSGTTATAEERQREKRMSFFNTFRFDNSLTFRLSRSAPLTGSFLASFAVATTLGRPEVQRDRPLLLQRHSRPKVLVQLLHRLRRVCRFRNLCTCVAPS